MAGIVGLITARGGSKGVPRKNIQVLAGKPLIAWTIEAALQSQELDRVIVSTDDREIASISRRFGAEVPFIRPLELALDASSHVDVILHAIDWLAENEQYDTKYITLLQPTSPFRIADDIDGAIQFAKEINAKSVIGMMEAPSHPVCLREMNEEGLLLELVPEQEESSLRRQVLTEVYAFNGALYVLEVDFFKKSKTFRPYQETYGYKMPTERSWEIDTEWEFLVASLLMKNQVESSRVPKAA
ncbi:MAG: acylneuraminate cytidylyltransferase family protein [Planctomycetes bacterium]|nr:acylneuraminate cytidylyltransferase family protein [Planctomycetota bacterium]MCH9723493.1 acylneuraminate cytidylyltransferase family protein [Planctomycetota bacterium]MCH9775286.1 acylneuraminate cytidylyltransferase family protein [Planctomycetota bacterium]MCH9789509.1 acylneuraminate cytidylyltransferase family protein [Planctomycetota bacterium]MDF1742877.1 acylneuraminate cytidylyltransferase family protein [Gimesia sp.]